MIKTIDEIHKIVRNLQKKARKVVTCNGSYDILHPGHIYLFNEAKKHGDVLIVGINSDKSYKKYKDKRGPINDEKNRALMVSSLKMVDHVFLFDDTIPNNWLKIIRPDVHVNASSYTKECIEASVLKEIGSELVLISDKSTFSTTKMIEKIIERYEPPKKTIFLDRDGTINVDDGFVHKVEDYRLEKNALSGLKKFSQMGYQMIVVTNQSGIGLGYYSEDDMRKFHDHMKKDLKEHGIEIADFYYCPHHPDSKIDKYRKVCDCQKPGRVMLQRGKKEHNVDMSRSFMIGDKSSDILAGKKMGLKTILLRTGFAGGEYGHKPYKVEPDFIADDLLDASAIISRLDRI